MPRKEGAVLDGILRELRQWQALHPAHLADRYFPNTRLTIVPLAIALATLTDSAQVAILLAQIPAVTATPWRRSRAASPDEWTASHLCRVDQEATDSIALWK
jgi:hypothetical protein